MDSLYGGHPGNSFVISSAFSSYNDMVTAFKQGPAYTAVWYNEYAILDTPNKNDKDNGKIYQRGLNYQDAETGGAIYIAQVVGPSSGTPYMSLDTIESVTKESTKKLEKDEYRRYPVGKDSQGRFITSDGSDGKKLATFGFDKNIESGLVPGKYEEDGQIKYNDQLKYTWVNLRKDNADSDSWFYIGMQNVYTVIDYSIHQTSPYDEQGNIKTDASEITRIDTKDHPYYEKWDLGLPKGVKGDTLRNLRVITPTAGNKNQIYAADAIIIDQKTGLTTLGAPGYTGIDDDIAGQRTILVFDYYVYDKKRNPQPVMIYLGDYNNIDKVQVADDGTLTLGYTHNDDTVFSKRIQWVNSVSLTGGDGSAGGHFTVNYNNGAKPFETDITWIKDIQINKTDGTVTYTYAGTNNGQIPANGKVIVPHLVKWVKSANLDSSNGHFEMVFNDDSRYENTLTWVKDITINEGNGDITFHQTTGDKKSNARLKLLTKAETSATGVIILHFNTGEKITVKNLNAETDYHIKVIEDVKLNTGILEDKHIQIRYNTNSAEKPYTAIGDPINYIYDMVVRPADWHLFVLYSDPAHRVKGTDLNDGKDKNGISWVSNDVIRTFSPNTPNHGSEVYWRDLGTIKDQHGILIGFNVSYEEVRDSGKKDIIEYLNETYPSGLTGEQNVAGGAATKQKVITYNPNSKESDKQDKEFYAFDYQKGYKSWYYLGTIADTGTRDIQILPESINNSDAWKNLSTQGVLIRKTSIPCKTTPMPDYWALNYGA